jgi:hypothetical protein
MARWLEAGIAAGFGALDEAVDQKAGILNAGPVTAKWSMVLEVAGVAAGLFGRKVGLSAEVREPVGFASLALLGKRGARLAFAGKLGKPGQWGTGGDGMGGDGMGGDDGSGNILGLGGGSARQVRIGRGGYVGIPPSGIYSGEAPGVAG